MMEYVQNSIGALKIEQCLSNLGEEICLDFNGLENLSDAAKDICKNHNICLDIYLTRHRYGDFSETDVETIVKSKKSLEKKTGKYVSSYKYKHFSLIITTELINNKTSIDVFVS
ncbi:hypothetical protein [Photorhabdus aegyptia]|uniref:Uncharacterized protein n=1 Tax=Photorhabdus aegyptia TaxID=2805098 RepID=A0A022PB65_9GAMM|nr:hypothetical protein [Photorhabdus aegyptia]EYU13417.1 hypothetical protein BA1DRAFT_04104 [Photorhabdus aegyptia]